MYGTVSDSLSHSPAAVACSGFAAVGPTSRRYRLIAVCTVPQHGTPQQMWVVPRLHLMQEAKHRPDYLLIYVLIRQLCVTQILHKYTYKKNRK